MIPARNWCPVVIALAALTAAAPAQHIIDAVITCDNSYALYVGDAVSASTTIGSATNTKAAAIFVPEVYSFAAPADGWFYVAAWSDDSILQGLLAHFDNRTLGVRLLSGDPLWQVTATGIDLDDLSPPPSVPELTSQIALANAGTNPSGGWVAPTISSTNGQGGIHEMVVPGIDANARWTWYNSGLDPRLGAPFIGFNHREYLIFRAPVTIPEPTATALLLCLLVAIGRRRYSFGASLC